jgi:hypothetical protein
MATTAGNRLTLDPKRHAPFYKKKNVAPCIADVPFFISSNDP